LECLGFFSGSRVDDYASSFISHGHGPIKPTREAVDRSIGKRQDESVF
jgi:hypothetical protein